MAVKVFVNSDNTATLRCPQCQKTRVVDVSKYMRPDAPTKLKAKCACGHSYAVYLEKRKYFRKQTNLEGVYHYSVSNGIVSSAEAQGGLTVLNISKTGMRLKLNSMPRFQVGDLINVEFRLDDSKKSLISRNVYVRNMKGLFIGVEYASQPSLDSALGFYLFH